MDTKFALKVAKMRLINDKLKKQIHLTGLFESKFLLLHLTI